MTMFSNHSALLVAVFLFAGMLAMDNAGIRIRARRNKAMAMEGNQGLGSLEGALLGLLALLLAFTFNLSALRYDARRQAVIDEANNIGTALLRADLYPDSIRDAFRTDFRAYIEARIRYYEAGTDETKIGDALNQSAAISTRIWQRAAAAAVKPDNAVRSMQMIPALNSMIDIVTSRDDKRRAHVPDSIICLLLTLCLVSAFVIGYGRRDKRVDWVLVCCFTLMITITVYLVLDLDQSRSGIITTDTAHLKILELRKMVQ